MSSGIWFVLFRRERTPSMDEILKAVAFEPDFQLQQIDATTFSISHEGAEVTVGLDTAPYVLAESREIADKAPPDRPELREQVASADTRFEITWDLAQRKRAFDAFMHVGGILRRMTGGVIYDQSRGEFV